MEEDLRGYLDWITQAEDLDLDNEPTSSGPNSSSNRHGGDNGAGKLGCTQCNLVLCQKFKSL